ncbi:MAG: NAD(P)H-hydrate dehydratase [Candidatus Freyarchaeota archaeon]|nr:NAD(P)H-hydrate dehydratase [Candidatus Freyrarchaeum guaymaensis]
MKVVTSEEMKAIDLNAEFLGVSRLLLMENAGRCVADAVARRFDIKEKQVVVFCGLGNNGGDGLVAARHFASLGAKVKVVLLGEEEKIRTTEARTNWNITKKLFKIEKIIVRDSSEIQTLRKTLAKVDVVIDAILGTGVKGEVREPAASAIDLINTLNCFKVSVDIPSGLNPDTGEIAGRAVKADLTVSFHAAKPALLGSQLTGELEVHRIGIPPEAELIAGPGDVEIIKVQRLPQSHKGDHGRVLIIGGGKQYSGAPALVALAALTMGVDIVVVAAPSSVAQAIRSYSPNLIVASLPGDVYTKESLDIVGDLLNQSSALAIGPGLGIERETQEAVLETIILAKEKDIPTVIDADGLKALPKRLNAVGNKMVLTPHQGEFTILTGENLLGKPLEEKILKVKEWAGRLNATILLKAHWDVISNGEKVKLNLTGNPGMTVGGTGDVLTGCCAAILSWRKEPFKAAVAAAFINGKAGDLAVQQSGYHITATDVIRYIPYAMDNKPVNSR